MVFSIQVLHLTTLPQSLLPAFSAPQDQLEVKPYAGFGRAYNSVLA